MQQKNETIAERLLLLRRRHGLSQPDFAEKIGINPRAYRNYELATREIPLSVIIGAHKAFAVDLYWLIFGETAPQSSPSIEVMAFIFDAIQEYEKNNPPLDSLKQAKILSYVSDKVSKNNDLSHKDIIDLIKLLA